MEFLDFLDRYLHAASGSWVAVSFQIVGQTGVGNFPTGMEILVKSRGTIGSTQL
jgi:hypothetical protein